jgi:hypothetical protein
MARILVCHDNTEPAWQVDYYDREVQPTLTKAGHHVHLTTCAQVLTCQDRFHPDVILMFAPTRQGTCWQAARSLRERFRGDLSPPAILVIVRWGPDDSPDDPAYYVRPEYWELYDEYYRDFWEDGEIARWIDRFLDKRQAR